MDTKILEEMGLLGDIRERLGAEDENDTSFDTHITNMNMKEAVAKWSAWSLGDESWANNIIDNYQTLHNHKLGILKKELEEKLIASSNDGKILLDDFFYALDKMYECCKSE